MKFKGELEAIVPPDVLVGVRVGDGRGGGGEEEKSFELPTKLVSTLLLLRNSTQLHLEAPFY